MGVSNHLPCNIEDVVDLLSIPVVRSSGHNCIADVRSVMTGRRTSISI